jgi:hypothetical protein
MMMRQISSRQDCDRAHKAAERTSAISRPRLHKRANFLRVMRRTTIGDHEKFSLGALDQALQELNKDIDADAAFVDDLEPHVAA